jgi:hypothetical protein
LVRRITVDGKAIIVHMAFSSIAIASIVYRPPIVGMSTEKGVRIKEIGKMRPAYQVSMMKDSPVGFGLLRTADSEALQHTEVLD